MGNRRRSRELAMQALFYVDMRQNKSEEILDLYLQSFTPSKKVLPFFLELVNGVIRERHQIDTMIERFSSNWKMSRMSCIDRNIMRIAVYEMLFCGDIPLKVSINEAIDVGKKFGTEESGAFINGILDSVRLVLEAEAIKIDTEVHTDKTH
jgi:N utilization substance protein B